MQYWLIWAIALGIGLVVALVVHSAVRLAHWPNVLVTLLAGLIGAAVGAFYVAQLVQVPEASYTASRFVWAFVGSVVLSLIAESSFAGARRGRVLTT